MSSVAENEREVSARDRRVFLRHCILALNTQARTGRVRPSFCRTNFAKKVGLKERVALVGIVGFLKFGICNAGNAHTKRNGYLPACRRRKIGL